MTHSVSAMTLYALLPIIAILIPYASFLLRKGKPDDQPVLSPVLCIALLSLAIMLTIFSSSTVPVFAVALLLPLIGRGISSMLGGMAAILIFATAIWWDPVAHSSAIPAMAFIALGTACAFLPRWQAPVGPHVRLAAPLLFGAVIGVFAGLPTAPFESTDQIFTAWHHWSAYMAPVEAWRGSGLPYRDFPIQYGLGPTALIMASCGTDCWAGLYQAAIVTNGLYFATLLGCVIILTARSSRGVRWLGIAALFCACFLWTGFPRYFAGPAMTPGVAGFRFLFLSALLLHILYAEECGKRRDIIGHGIWLASLFWSPEAGAFSTLVWWPYLALRNAENSRNGGAAIGVLVREAVRGVMALCAGAALLVLLLFYLSAGGISTDSFLAYVQHPPGMLPIDPAGAVWIALVPVIIAALMLARRGVSASARPLYACLLTMLAGGIYYISRSHDNNILNLFPLLIPLLLTILNGIGRGDNRQDFPSSLIHTLLAAMIAFVALFNFEPWLSGLRSVGPLSFGPTRLLAKGEAILSPDAVAGLQYLRQRDGGMVILLDERKIIVRQPGDASWTGVNNVANFWPLPDAMIAHYIARGADAYRKPGWILVQDSYASWVDAFKKAYAIREERRFGRYTAYYIAPRPRNGFSDSNRKPVMSKIDTRSRQPITV